MVNAQTSKSGRRRGDRGRRHGVGAGDAAQGRHDPHDGALRRKLRQPRSHTTPRAQDDIVNKALQRTLYNWDSKDGKLVLELAKSVTPSEDGLTYTYKLRDDAYFHNGRKMTADDIIWSYTRIMDGSKGYPPPATCASSRARSTSRRARPRRSPA
jgi:ABC-type transport system substrate-binding protein